VTFLLTACTYPSQIAEEESEQHAMAAHQQKQDAENHQAKVQLNLDELEALERSLNSALDSFL
jgi:outer membrane biogenesis lipoprotein LolB